MVFVLSKQKKPMDNCTPAKARLLLRDGLATIHKQYPFTIRLKDNAAHTADKTYQIKLDPGSKTTRRHRGQRSQCGFLRRSTAP